MRSLIKGLFLASFMAAPAYSAELASPAGVPEAQLNEEIAALATTYATVGVALDVAVATTANAAAAAAAQVTADDALPLAGGNMTGDLGFLGSGNLKMRITGSNPTHGEGILFYDNTSEQMSYYNSESDVTAMMGNLIMVRNTSGGQIDKCQPIYTTGSQGTKVTIDLAIGDNDHRAQVIGLMAHDLSNNSNGFAMGAGRLEGCDTSAFNEGDLLHLSTITAGTFMLGHVIGPGFDVIVGRVLKSNASTGIIEIHPGAHLSVGVGAANQHRGMNAAGDEETFKDFIAGEGIAILETSTSTTFSASAAQDLSADTDGTAAAPVFTFDSDPDTGWYRKSEDNLGFGIGGVEAGTITATGFYSPGTFHGGQDPTINNNTAFSYTEKVNGQGLEFLMTMQDGDIFFIDVSDSEAQIGYDGPVNMSGSEIKIDSQAGTLDMTSGANDQIEIDPGNDNGADGETLHLLGPTVLTGSMTVSGDHSAASYTGDGSALTNLPGGGGDFSNGGEAGTADRSLGNTDNFDFSILTNNVARVDISGDGAVVIPQASSFTVVGSAAYPLASTATFHSSGKSDIVLSSERSSSGDRFASIVFSNKFAGGGTINPTARIDAIYNGGTPTNANGELRFFTNTNSFEPRLSLKLNAGRANLATGSGLSNVDGLLGHVGHNFPGNTGQSRWQITDVTTTTIMDFQIFNGGSYDSVIEMQGRGLKRVLLYPNDEFVARTGINDPFPISALDVNGGITPAQLTATPCGTSEYGEGTLFYNQTAKYFCFCNGTDDVQFHSPLTDCFP